MADVGAPLGNQNASKGKEWTAALRAAMAHRGDGDYRAILRQIANGVIDKALSGDLYAIQEIANREDGKPHQSIGGDEGGAAIIIKLLAKDETA